MITSFFFNSLKKKVTIRKYWTSVSTATPKTKTTKTTVKKKKKRRRKKKKKKKAKQRQLFIDPNPKYLSAPVSV